MEILETLNKNLDNENITSWILQKYQEILEISNKKSDKKSQ